MDAITKYRGKLITSDDIAFINQLISEHPAASRWMLSKKLCLAWNWTQANGALRDMVCRGLMLHLHREGHITLPPKKHSPPNPFTKRRKPSEPSPINQTPLQVPLPQLKPLKFRQVRRSEEEALFNSLVERFHYLGYTQPVGEHLKYIIYAHDRPLACMAWSSAPRHIGCRDRYIGWPAEIRKKHLHFIAYNTRFLILPWIQVKYLASHILSQMARVLPKDWQAMYNHPIYFLETFVDEERFRGTCYYAANWRFLGKTTGRGKDDQTNKQNRSLKAVLGYPLSKRFREQLSGEAG